ncbi:hypothetical protein EHZ86_20460 [Aeromonas australiensis]|uniref:hypothetical protein n=1 Tax=Aeromonas TaxID=642 RepID=UPI001115E85A|nr:MULTISPECIES: hypothetical protein [Aeromonas]MCF3099563.1 hypothetical protein [Aeromonas australiensis]TNI62222.1 hypothetical protein CF121_08175 [Aeromonas media]
MVKVLALVAHLFGIAIATGLVYFVSPIVAEVINKDEGLTRTTLLGLLVLWGLWTAIQIIRGKDSIVIKLEKLIKVNGRL